jgi:hypothetical protein
MSSFRISYNVYYLFSKNIEASLPIRTMDFSFAPINRFRDIYRTKHPQSEPLNNGSFSEVQLATERHQGDSSGTPCRTTWNDFRTSAQQHIVWTDDQAFVCTAEETGWQIGYRRFFSITVTRGSNDPPSPTRIYVWAPCIQSAVGTCDVLLQLLAACPDDADTVHWKSMAGNLVEFPVSAGVLAAYLEQQKNRSLLFTMDSFTMSTELCRVLATLQTSYTVVIELARCRFRSSTAARCLAESPQLGRGSQVSVDAVRRGLAPPDYRIGRKQPTY